MKNASCIACYCCCLVFIVARILISLEAIFLHVCGYRTHHSAIDTQLKQIDLPQTKSIYERLKSMTTPHMHTLHNSQ